MKTVNIKKTALRSIGRSKLFLKRHKSDILFGVGVTGMVVAFVGGCKASMKLEETSANCAECLEEVKSKKDEIPEKEYNTKLARAYGHVAGSYAKLYGPSVTIGAASMACLIISHASLKSENKSLAMAYATLDRCFNAYRQRVIDEHGEDADMCYRYGIKKETVQVPDVDPETGEVVGSHDETVDTVDNLPSKFSPAAFMFDRTSRNWSEYNEDNDMFCRMVQASADQMLQSYGHLFLNDVRKMFALPPTPAGQTLGWVLNRHRGTEPDETHHVEFGIAVIRNGDERSILIDPNVDGPILSYFDDTTLDEEYLSESHCEIIHSLRGKMRA